MSETDPNLVVEITNQLSYVYFAYVFAATIILYLAWRSTYVRDSSRLELYRRRTLFILNPQTGQFERHPIVLQPQESNTPNETEQIDLDEDQLVGGDGDNNIVQLPTPPPTLESILDEVNGFASGVSYNNPAEQLETELIDEEAQAIIREMDSGINTPEGLRQRRLAFFRNVSDSAASMPISMPSTSVTATPGPSAPQAVSSNNESAVPTVEVSKKQPIVAAASPDEADSVAAMENVIQSTEHFGPEITYGDELTIKLKYLNDDLKIVKGRPTELIGDFKRYEFHIRE